VPFLDYPDAKYDGFEVLELAENSTCSYFNANCLRSICRSKAFELHAVDYLLKPFSQRTLDEALNHVQSDWKNQKNRLPIEALALVAGMKTAILATCTCKGMDQKSFVITP